MRESVRWLESEAKGLSSPVRLLISNWWIGIRKICIGASRIAGKMRLGRRGVFDQLFTVRRERSSMVLLSEGKTDRRNGARNGARATCRCLAVARSGGSM